MEEANGDGQSGQGDGKRLRAVSSVSGVSVATLIRGLGLWR